jgi:hypothetical protein
LELIFCAAKTVDLLPKPFVDWALRTTGGPKNATTIQMAYTFMEVLRHVSIKRLRQASVYDDWPSVLEQSDAGRIVQTAKTWGAAGVRVEGIDGLTYEERTDVGIAPIIGNRNDTSRDNIGQDQGSMHEISFG